MEFFQDLGEIIIAHPIHVLVYLATVNLVAFIMYGVDKFKAKRGSWRIPERRLIGAALLGGSLGALAGMLVFRHKTQHAKFVVSVPLLLALHTFIAAVIVIFARLG